MKETKIRKLKRVVIKEELVALTGKLNEAIVLNQFIFWSERIKDADKFLNEEIERTRKFMDGSEESEEDIKEFLRNGWIYKTAEEMIDDCMLTMSRQTMNRIIDNLVDNGWLNKRKNPKHKWDKTWQYRVNLNKIQNDLMNLGFSLEGYTLLEPPIKSSNVQNEPSNVQIEQSNAQSEPSNAQNEHAIPKITTEITTENTDRDQSIKEEEIKELHVPDVIKKQLNREIDRLIDDNIFLEDIELVYQAVKDDLTEYQFADVLSTVLRETKGKIQNINNLLHTAIRNYRQSSVIQMDKPNKHKRRAAPLPKWMTDQESISVPANFEEKRRRLEMRLKKYK